MSENPFAVGGYAGGSESDRVSADPNQHPLMQEMLTLLAQTRPWVRFFGILAFVCAGLMLLAGVGIILFGLAGVGRQQPFRQVIGVVYFLLSVFYIYPALCLNRYASAIKEAETSADMQYVVEAILHQKKFWRFCGILTAVVLAIYFVIFFVAVVGGIIGGMLAAI